MNKKSTVIALIIGILILVLPAVFYFFTGSSEESALPEPNIPTQTKTVNGITITLQNAKYNNKELQLGYEIEGGGQSENDLGYTFYNEGDPFVESVSGTLLQLGDKHYYITAKTDQIRDLPESLNLTFEIKARPNSAEQHNISIPFELVLEKEKS
ncbi:hypothetical protein [Paenibacillus cucumis (ex Kampfer et al. 2016)]|uniref:DUF4179 domain-containing protein n=1 Tax=Paenibacillus cucumis (ex Kampfer et al. 2016) TaxID=1776858 RepID=A0ABS7KKQ0_9BACL|nr:hypothetical protein [Paenibacillus cucumis (ex Kampfer et al. 2016)]MBY0204675.1 hypothetical protein [Paenibacillus cucumis (ex Kampfer et al. 2016)]